MEFVFPVANAILYSFMGPRFQKDLLRLVFINGSCRLICNRMTYIGQDNLMKIWKPSKDSLVDSRTNVRFNYFYIKYLFFLFRPISDFNSVYFNDGSEPIISKGLQDRRIKDTTDKDEHSWRVSIRPPHPPGVRMALRPWRGLTSETGDKRFIKF